MVSLKVLIEVFLVKLVVKVVIEFLLRLVLILMLMFRVVNGIVFCKLLCNFFKSVEFLFVLLDVRLILEVLDFDLKW